MSDIAIKVDGISKLFRLGAKEEREETATASLLKALKSPLENFRKYRGLYNFDDVDLDSGVIPEGVLWALRDVSFTIRRGEVVGLIGMNGAGKSTLLKILSRITPPTRGRAEIHGRVYSLLEVGTGFHQDLSGRDNVYLNGTILGMKKVEIDRKFDEIVAFSGIEKFIDTPVKRYSSGMKVRLAFAVAAHLEPEILIVDEVLAVGDAAFQKKCLNKMQDVGEMGATVLFVSHNMPSVTRLCSRGILLQAGRVIRDGSPADVVSAYLSAGLGTSAARKWDEGDSAPGSDTVRLRSARICDENGNVLEAPDIHRPIVLTMEYDVLVGGSVLLPNFNVLNEEGVHVFTTLDVDPQWKGKPRPAGRYISRAVIPGNLMAEGTFYMEPAMMTPAPFRAHFKVNDALAFQVVDSAHHDGARSEWAGKVVGVVRPMLEWTTEYLPR